MKKEIEKFDTAQGHGDHNDCLFGRSEDGGMEIVDRIRKMMPTSVICGRTETEIPCSMGAGLPDSMSFVMLASDTGAVRLQTLVGVVEAGKQNTLISAYPECEGATVEVRLTAVHEWANGVEATLEGTMLGDEERNVAFFDTRYALNKGKYVIGERYRFSLAALGYDDCEIMPEKDRKIVLTSEQSERILKTLGKEPKRLEDGSIEPLAVDQSTGVVYWSSSAAYPDDAFFQSPVFERVRTVKAFERRYHVFTVGIARSNEKEDVDIVIPLYARSGIFAIRPHKGDPLRGHIWLHGYRIQEAEAQG